MYNISLIGIVTMNPPISWLYPNKNYNYLKINMWQSPLLKNKIKCRIAQCPSSPISRVTLGM
jgi:hypothetical protein